MVFRAMQLTGVTDPRRVAKVGDTPSDLHESTNAGCGMVVAVSITAVQAAMRSSRLKYKLNMRRTCKKKMNWLHA